MTEEQARLRASESRVLVERLQTHCWRQPCTRESRGQRARVKMTKNV